MGYVLGSFWSLFIGFFFFFPVSTVTRSAYFLCQGHFYTSGRFWEMVGVFDS